MSFYLYIRPRQEPFPFDIDDQNRFLFSCNYEAEGSNISWWEMDIVTILSQAGIAQENVNVWIGRGVTLPAGDGPYVLVINTGGRDPEKTHNGDVCRYPSAQVVVAASDYEAANNKSLEIWNELVKVSNREV